MNKWTEKKAVNVSFLIDDIDGWFAAVKERALFPLRGTAVSDDDAGRYRAFVGYDPEGYYMEFDLFRAHPANATLMPYLGTPAAKWDDRPGWRPPRPGRENTNRGRLEA